MLSSYFVRDFMHKKSRCEQSKKHRDKQRLNIENIEPKHRKANTRNQQRGYGQVSNFCWAENKLGSGSRV